MEIFRENMLQTLPSLGAEVTHDRVQSFIAKHPETYRAIRDHFSQAGFTTREQRDSHEVMAVCAAILTDLPGRAPRSYGWQLEPDPRIFTLERTEGGGIRITGKKKEGHG